MSLFGQTKRYTPAKPRRSPLPIFSDEEKKYGLGGTAPLSGSSKWFTVIYVPVPFSRSSSQESPLYGNGLSSSRLHNPKKRYCRLFLPIPPRLYGQLPRNPLRLVLIVSSILIVCIFLLGFRKRRGSTTWSPPFVDPDTLVLAPEELAMIWEWEVLSGHYPSIHQRKSMTCKR